VVEVGRLIMEYSTAVGGRNSHKIFVLCQLDVLEAVEILYRIQYLLWPAFKILRPG